MLCIVLMICRVSVELGRCSVAMDSVHCNHSLHTHTSPSSSPARELATTTLEAQKEDDEVSKVCVK